MDKKNELIQYSERIDQQLTELIDDLSDYEEIARKVGHGNDPDTKEQIDQLMQTLFKLYKQADAVKLALEQIRKKDEPSEPD